MKQLIFILLTLFTSSVFAKEEFFEQRYRGWLWFDQQMTPQPSEVEMKQEKKVTKEEMLKAKADNEQFKEELALLKHLMLRHPDNLEYIRLYKMKEKEMLEKAVILGSNWQLVNFLNPEIVDELRQPENMYGRKIQDEEQNKRQQKMIQSLAGKVELFVFRQKDCPYCSYLEKHLANFAGKYGFKVEAVSNDQSTSSYFKTHASRKLIKALGLEVMPTVIAVVNDTRQRFELARGAVSVADLEEKALLLVNYLDKEAAYAEVK